MISSASNQFEGCPCLRLGYVLQESSRSHKCCGQLCVSALGLSSSWSCCDLLHAVPKVPWDNQGADKEDLGPDRHPVPAMAHWSFKGACYPRISASCKCLRMGCGSNGPQPLCPAQAERSRHSCRSVAMAMMHDIESRPLHTPAVPVKAKPMEGIT